MFIDWALANGAIFHNVWRYEAPRILITIWIPAIIVVHDLALGMMEHLTVDANVFFAKFFCLQNYNTNHLNKCYL